MNYKRRIIMYENQYQTFLGEYLREVKDFYGYFELKATTLNYLSFNKIEPHQYEGLQATKKNGLYWKMSDQDMRLKPCDCMKLPPLPSYLVIRFTDAYYMVDIKHIVQMKEDGKIAITREEAKNLADKIIKISKSKKYDKTKFSDEQ
jgi:hypothetical protein